MAVRQEIYNQTQNMKLESINSPKFPTLSNEHKLIVKGGGATGAGGEARGIPTYDQSLRCYIIPVRIWSSDSFKDGVWCYTGLEDSEIYSPNGVYPS